MVYERSSNIHIPKPKGAIKHSCSHVYKVLQDDTNMYYSDKDVRFCEVSAVFYCEKCLDIQLKKAVVECDNA